MGVAAARLKALADRCFISDVRIVACITNVHLPASSTSRSGFRRTSPPPLSPRNRRDRRDGSHTPGAPKVHERRVRDHDDRLLCHDRRRVPLAPRHEGRRVPGIRLIVGKTEGRLNQSLPPVRARVLPRQPVKGVAVAPPARRAGAPRPPRRRRRATLSRRSRRSRRAPGPGGRF